jgi:hypothetical protein
LENFIEKEDDLKSLASISQISKSNSSIHSLDTSIDFKYRYVLREKRKINYLETSSDNEEDLIPLTDYARLDWISHLKRIPEFNSKCEGVQSTCDIPANTILGFYEGKYVENLQEVRKILRGPRPHYIIECVKDKLWIDGSPKYSESNIFGLINHHCTDINVKLVKVTKKKIMVVTSQLIKKNDYLHFDYRIRYTVPNEIRTFIDCLCCVGCPNKL